MVCYAITVARTAPERTPARIRIPSYAVWETVVFVLNVLAFVFIGLQIRPILDSLEPALRGRYFAVAGAVLVTVIVVRIAWHMSFNAVIRWRDRRFGFHPPRPMLRPTVGSGLVISWAGMRGIVTLAAALALPAAFPFRDLIVLTAFSVVLGTLALQGLTLEPAAARARSARRRSGRPRSRRRARTRPARRAGGVRARPIAGRRSGPAGVHRASRLARAPILKKAKRDGSPTATFTAGRFRRRARPFSPCAPATRSATMRFIRWKRNWTGSKCPTPRRKMPRLRTKAHLTNRWRRGVRRRATAARRLAPRAVADRPEKPRADRRPSAARRSAWSRHPRREGSASLATPPDQP